MPLVAMSGMIGRSVGSRYRDADWVGAEPRVGTPPRRYGRPRVGDVDEMDRDHACPGAHLAIGADPADMVRIAQGDDRDPVALALSMPSIIASRATICPHARSPS